MEMRWPSAEIARLSNVAGFEKPKVTEAGPDVDLVGGSEDPLMSCRNVYGLDR